MKLSHRFCAIPFLLLICFLGLTTKTYGQIEKIGAIIKAGSDDAETLTRAYLKPLPNGIGANLNAGWFNTASTHKLLGFDIQIRGGLAPVPSSDRHFNFNRLNLTNTKLADGESPFSPTAAGEQTPGAEVVIRDNGKEVARLQLPQGTGFHYVPAPVLQASLGLVKHTDFMVRFVPPVSLKSYGDINMYGFGLKHALNQWFAGGHFPIAISVLAAYTHLKLNGNLDVKPASNSVHDPNFNGSYDNQKAIVTDGAFTAKLLVSKELPFLSIYGGVGFETSTMHLALRGNYPVPVRNKGVKQTTTVTDPFSYRAHANNNFSLTGGLKFKLSFINIFGDYTLADYSVLNGGIGFSFR